MIEEIVKNVVASPTGERGFGTLFGEAKSKLDSLQQKLASVIPSMPKRCFFYYRAATKRRTAQRQHSSLIIMEQRRMNMSKLTYIRCGDYDIPNLKLSVLPETSIGKYGRMRKSYLKEHRPILYNHLLMSEKLYPHLLAIERTAQGRVETMLPHMMETAGVTEELKARDPMRWVGLMNTLKAQAEEIIFQELISA